jgi:hypothetical protein
MGLPPPLRRSHENPQDKPNLQVLTLPQPLTISLLIPTQRRALQDPHLDHPPYSRRPNQLPRPERQPYWPSLRCGSWLPLGHRLHQVPRTSREDITMGRNEAQPTR